MKPIPPVLLMVLLVGCAVGPDYQEPEVELPGHFDAELEGGAEARELARWWTRFEDPLLAELIERAVAGNLELAAAVSRLDQARALWAAETSGRYPALDGVGSGQRIEPSDNAPLGPLAGYDDYRLGLEAGWELDFWGRVRRSVEAAQGELDATAEDARDVLVLLVATVGQAYVELRGFEARLAIAEGNVELQGQTLELVRVRSDAGLVSQLDVVRARASLEETRAAIPALERGAELARDRLAVLAGQPPGSLDALLGVGQGVPRPPAELSGGAPAELLRRRPDVRAAERRLAAATARIGVAEAERFPRFELTGAIGLEAEDLGDLFESESVGSSWGPAFRWPLFDAGRRRSVVDLREAEVDERLLAYRAAVLLAIEEVEAAAEGFARERRRLGSLESAAADYERALELSREQYRQGLIAFQDVLDVQRSVFAAQDAVELSRIAIASAAVDLFRALGGGWEPPAD